MSLSQETINTLISDAHYIFNNPPGESSQEVRDVIEWFAGSLGVDAAHTQPAPVTSVEVPRLTEAQIESICRVGAVYAPDGMVTRHPIEYRRELEANARNAVRKAEAALIAKWSKT